MLTRGGELALAAGVGVEDTPRGVHGRHERVQRERLDRQLARAGARRPRRVMRSTALIASISARAWSGTSPTANGTTPAVPTTHGTSTTARSSRNGQAAAVGGVQDQHAALVERGSPRRARSPGPRSRRRPPTRTRVSRPRGRVRLGEVVRLALAPRRAPGLERLVGRAAVRLVEARPAGAAGTRRATRAPSGSRRPCPTRSSGRRGTRSGSSRASAATRRRRCRPSSNDSSRSSSASSPGSRSRSPSWTPRSQPRWLRPK